MQHIGSPQPVIWFTRCGILLAPLLCIGCGDVADKFDVAIKEIQSLRTSIEKESTAWRDQLKNSQLQLTKDVRTILNVDLRDNIDKSIAEAGIEVRCDADFTQGKLVDYLTAVESAINAKKAQLARDGLLKTLKDPETVISDVIKSVDHVAPYVCHTIPGRLSFSYLTETQKTPDRQTVEFVGYALKRGANESKTVTLYVFGPHRGTSGVELQNSADLMATTHTYKRTLDAVRLGKVLDVTDTKLALRWGDDTVSEVLLAFTVSATPTPPPKAVAIHLHVDTTDDDKDREIAFHYLIHQPGVGPISAESVQGANEVWPDHPTTHKDFRISLLADKGFVYGDRLKYALRITYTSSHGDPKWEGHVSARVEFDNGDVKDVLGDSGRFAMGHLGGHPERRMRDFQFNQ